MRKRWLAPVCAAVIVSTAVPMTVQAEDVKEGAQKAPWDIEVEASYLLKNGNSNSESLVGKINALYDGAIWRQTFKAEAVNTMGEDDDGNEERTAERYHSSYKLDRKFGDRNYLFNILTYEKDRFSGYHYQASYALGLGRRFVATPTQTLDLEAGPGYRVQCLEPQDSYFNCNDSEDSAILRLAGKYRWKISDHASFGQDISTEIGEQNTTLRSETSLTSQVSKHFALRLSYLLLRNSYVPDDEHKTDTETSVSVVYKF